MRRLLAVLLTVYLPLLGCSNEDPPALFVDVSYQLRCIDCEPRVGDAPARNLQLVDGEMGTRVTCYTSPSGTGPLINLQVNAADYEFRIQRARLGGEQDPQCEVHVKEGAGNTYVGRCRDAGDSSSNAPCELDLTPSSGGFSGTVRCERIPHQNTNLFRYVMKPNTTAPAEITVHGCTGL